MLDFELAFETITTAGINTTGTCVSSPSVISTHRRGKGTSPSQKGRELAESMKKKRWQELLLCPPRNRRSESAISFCENWILFQYGHSFSCMVTTIFCQLPAEVTILMQSCLSPLPWLHLPAFTVSSGSSRNNFLGVCSTTPSSQKPWLKSAITVWCIPLP